MTRKIAFWAMMVLAGGIAAAQADFTDSQLQAELWIPLQPLLPGELERRATDSEKLDALLEEMQVIFSGMIYGWSFDYRPGTPDKRVPESLNVVPLGRIIGTTGKAQTARAWAWATHVDETSGVMSVDFRYVMTPMEQERRAAWASSDLDASSGVGKSLTIDRLETRLEALRQSLKDAVRNLLRPRYYNRPEEIRGEAGLAQAPRMVLQSGSYVCTATFQIRVISVREYPLY